MWTTAILRLVMVGTLVCVIAHLAGQPRNLNGAGSARTDLFRRGRWFRLWLGGTCVTLLPEAIRRFGFMGGLWITWGLTGIGVVLMAVAVYGSFRKRAWSEPHLDGENRTARDPLRPASLPAGG